MTSQSAFGPHGTLKQPSHCTLHAVGHLRGRPLPPGAVARPGGPKLTLPARSPWPAREYVRDD
jgi:hypothetical protein